MSGAIAGSVTQPSKAYSIAHVLFGYALTLAVIPSLKDSGDPTKYLIIIAIIGGFMGTFLFLLKPIEKIMYWHYKHSFEKIFQSEEKSLFIRAFFSPFLTEPKGQIIAGTFFSMTCLLALVNPNFSLLNLETAFLVRVGLAVIFFIVTKLNFNRFNRLNKKIRILLIYYGEIVKIVPNEVYELLIEHLKDALGRKDWDEASSIVFKYNQLLAESEKKKNESKELIIKNSERSKEIRQNIFGPLFEEMNRILENVKNANITDFTEPNEIKRIMYDYRFSTIDNELKIKVSKIYDEYIKYQDVLQVVESQIQPIVRNYIKDNFKLDIGKGIENLPNLSLYIENKLIAFTPLVKLILLKINPQKYVENERKKWDEKLKIKISLGINYRLSDLVSIYDFTIKNLSTSSFYKQEKEIKSRLITQIEELLESLKIFIISK